VTASSLLRVRKLRNDSLEQSAGSLQDRSLE